MKHALELVAKNVLKGSDTTIECPFTYIPRSGRKAGDPVDLVPAQTGPLWYSSRMVKDEHVRLVRGQGSRFGADEEQSSPPGATNLPPSPKASPMGGFGEAKGDGSLSSSSSSPSGRERRSTPTSFEEFSDNMPMDSAKELEMLQRRINSLNPSWSKRPSFTRAELGELLSNRRIISEVPETDWKLLAIYMDATIDPNWPRPPYWQPDQRGKLISSFGDVLSHADRWKRECTRRGINIEPLAVAS